MIPWDAACTESFSNSDLYTTILNLVPASSTVKDVKRRKYSQQEVDVDIVMVAVEMSAIVGSAGFFILADISRRILKDIDDPRLMSYIFQQISVAIIPGDSLATTSLLHLAEPSTMDPGLAG